MYLDLILYATHWLGNVKMPLSGMCTGLLAVQVKSLLIDVCHVSILEMDILGEGPS